MPAGRATDPLDGRITTSGGRLRLNDDGQDDGARYAEQPGAGLRRVESFGRSPLAGDTRAPSARRLRIGAGGYPPKEPFAKPDEGTGRCVESWPGSTIARVPVGHRSGTKRSRTVDSGRHRASHPGVPTTPASRTLPDHAPGPFHLHPRRRRTPGDRPGRLLQRHRSRLDLRAHADADGGSLGRHRARRAGRRARRRQPRAARPHRREARAGPSSTRSPAASPTRRPPSRSRRTSRSRSPSTTRTRVSRTTSRSRTAGGDQVFEGDRDRARPDHLQRPGPRRGGRTRSAAIVHPNMVGDLTVQ